MLVTLTNETLNEDLQKTLQVFSRFPGPSQYALFSTLYNHGFRINELKLILDWEIVDSETLIAKTLKGSNDRVINISTVDPLILQSIADNKNYLFTTSYDTLLRDFKKAKPALYYQVGGKKIGTHLFRHNRIKQMYADGLSVEAIKAKTGLKNDTVVMGYVDSVITAQYL